MSRKLIVTHHSPDVDAITSVWLLKRFLAREYADAYVGFVNPGSTITLEAAEEYGVQLHEVTHVDTGLGEFDHHQTDRGMMPISASSLVYDHIVEKYPDQKRDQALAAMIQYVTDIDHFGEIYWPETDHPRYSFMLVDIIRGLGSTDPHNDESVLQFGFKALDSIYTVLTLRFKAEEIIVEKGEEFMLPIGKCLAVSTSNDEVIKIAQKQGYMVVIRKDPDEGNIRIKARPDADINFNALAEKITRIDTTGTWYNHPSGKMLINGSQKHRQQKASPLSLEQVVSLIKSTYGN